ncbi:MAG TPA: outer membrane beta-barrel family protein, partial [Chitinophagaceae bacterium]|nr:outer membrane beta-barrel family protein [Chitinophagaceae bacterium]
RRFYITANLNGGIDPSVYTGYSNVTYPDTTSLQSNTLRDNNNRRYFFRAGVVYDLHPRHSIFLQALTTGSRMRQTFRSDLIYTLHASEVTGLALSEWLRTPKQGSYTLNYGWKTDSVGSGLRIIFDHTYSIKRERNEVNSAYSDTLRDQTYRSITPSDTYINSGQADYTQTLKKQALFKAGIKWVYTKRDNSVLTERIITNAWQKDSAASDVYHYSEELLMFYLSYERTFGNTSVKAGLRGEQTIAEGRSITTGESIKRSYFGWFPSFFISHVINNEKGSAISFNYARRVRRPGYNDLNPYRLQVHDFTILTGNPNLVPQYTHSFRVNYALSKNYSTGAYLQTTKNFIAQIASVVDTTIIEYMSKNFPNSAEYGIFLEGNITIGKIWNSRNSVFFYRASNDIDEIKYKRNSLSAQSIQVISLKKIMDIDWVTQYTSSSLQANAKKAFLFFMDIGFTRAVFKERGRLRFAVTDIFNTFREKDITDFNQTRVDFYQKRPTRTFGLSFNYTFRSGKAFTKKRLDNNDSEEKSRL